MKKLLTFIFAVLTATILNAQVTTSAQLNASTSTDTDGTIVKYQWVKHADSPTGGDLASPQAAISTISNLVEGIYKYDLTVTDNEGATGSTVVTVTVTANKAPIARASDLSVRITNVQK